jgi:CelD/BcsL family acetyltransferase involved in cellulose biosynthesis
LFALELSALWSGDRLAAVMASLRSRHVVHSWFPAYEPELSDFTPGIGLYLKLAECSAERQFTRSDLGKGEERYKLQLSTPGTLLATGTVERSSLGIWLRRGWRTTKQWLEPASAEQAAAGARWLQPVRSWLAMR